MIGWRGDAASGAACAIRSSGAVDAMGVCGATGVAEAGAAAFIATGATQAEGTATGAAATRWGCAGAGAGAGACEAEAYAVPASRRHAPVRMSSFVMRSISTGATPRSRSSLSAAV